MLQAKTIDEYINRYQVDGVMWKAQKLLGELPATDIRRNDNVIQMANTLALISLPVLRDDYAKKICKEHNIIYKTLEKLITDAFAINKKKDDIRKTVRKNKIATLEGDPRKFRFFIEKTKDDKENGIILDRVKVDKYKFVQLLASFGFTRYETDSIGEDDRDDFAFVQLNSNVIIHVTRNKIIDHIEKFVKNEYDFEGAGYALVDAETLINTFYDQIRNIFSKDLFARVRTSNPIIMNKDTKDITYFYYKNGFVEVTKNGWNLRSYDEMSGSVWEHQMLNRNFTKIESTDLKDMGYFFDFCFRISGAADDDQTRFESLCTLIGYLTHDFYDYKLKCVEFTDSSLSEVSDGRSGKTLLVKIIGLVRSYCEINGKDFDATNKNKYQNVKIGAQMVHLNDVKHHGKNRFDFEDVFNDVTEGYIVDAKYMTPFRQFSKIIISTNKTLNIKGPSQRDRIIEFEMSTFFGEHRSPADHYKHWFISDWDEAEFNRFDNFMCYCSMMFHINGIITPPTINLGERKLMNHTSMEFLEFMDDVAKNLKETGVPWSGYESTTPTTNFAQLEIHQFAFDKKRMFERFVHDYPDFKNSWLTSRTFSAWLKQYADVRLGVKATKEWKSNGASMIQFIPEEKK